MNWNEAITDWTDLWALLLLTKQQGIPNTVINGLFSSTALVDAVTSCSPPGRPANFTDLCCWVSSYFKYLTHDEQVQWLERLEEEFDKDLEARTRYEQPISAVKQEAKPFPTEQQIILAMREKVCNGLEGHRPGAPSYAQTYGLYSYIVTCAKCKKRIVLDDNDFASQAPTKEPTFPEE